MLKVLLVDDEPFIIQGLKVLIDWEQEGYMIAGTASNGKEAYDFLKKAGTYYLATVDGDQPRVRPFGTIDIFEDKLYIQTGKGKDVFKQANGAKVELCCFDGEKWLRLAGTLVDDDRVEPKKHMLDNYPNLRAMYDENDGNTAVFYFTHATATFSSFTAAPETVTF